MKNKLSYFFVLLLPFSLLFSCHKLDVPVKSALTPDIFPQNSEQFIQASGPAYAALRGDYSTRYWFMQSLSTDESIFMARGGNWLDNQNYSMLHYHSWTRDHGFTNTTWSWLSVVIGTTNQALSILDETMPAGASKDGSLAELKMVRAFAYYMMMDLYGNIPIYTVYGDFEPKANSPRNEVFNFIETEIKACLPYLSNVTGITTYGRMTKYAAFALLAKMYLNAQYYTGTARYNDCVSVCDSVISSNKFEVESRSTYLGMFRANNGPQMKEFIFAIPYDPSATPITGTHGYMFHSRYDIPRSMGPRFQLAVKPDGPRSTIPGFYAYFNDPLDIRNDQWLKGLQYNTDGSPLTVKTTKKGYDQFYTGADGNAEYIYHVNLTPDVELRLDPLAFDAGNDEIAWNMGYRNTKFYPDNTTTTRNQNNDAPVFRYADILLMKAEAILRGGTATSNQTPLSLVEMVRSKRTTAAPLSAISLEDLYAERCREFAWEGWHRNDMIRFEKYENVYAFKTNNDITRRIYPIPITAMALNPSLKQNPGY